MNQIKLSRLRSVWSLFWICMKSTSCQSLVQVSYWFFEEKHLLWFSLIVVLLVKQILHYVFLHDVWWHWKKWWIQLWCMSRHWIDVRSIWKDWIWSQYLHLFKLMSSCAMKSDSEIAVLILTMSCTLIYDILHSVVSSVETEKLIVMT